jgi:hypothetical protein
MYFPWGTAKVPQKNICSESLCNHNYFMFVFI